MSRYIDADALQKRLSGCEFETNCVSEENKKEILKILRIFIPQIIASEPTADAEPISHGRWVNETYCSVCGRFPVDTTENISNRRLTKFFDRCPHCGAKMDGGDSNDMVKNT